MRPAIFGTSVSVARRACALVAVLALIVSALEPAGTTSAGCGACPPGCPMHARGLGCHQKRQMSCHHAAPATGIRSACGHARETASSGTAAFRGVLPAGMDVRPRLSAGMSLRPLPLLAARPQPEPPTGPPRSSVV